jgi:hypothetical protein
MILSTILNHFRLKRRIRQAADDLESQFDHPVVEAKMRAFCERTARQVHFWSRVALELEKREGMNGVLVQDTHAVHHRPRRHAEARERQTRQRERGMSSSRPAINFGPQPCTLADFRRGDRVRYIPNHAHGDSHHPDCQTGTVTSVSVMYVFVRFKGETSEACDAEDLIKWANK